MTNRGMSFPVLGGRYGAYELLGARRGPLRIIACATGCIGFARYQTELSGHHSKRSSIGCGGIRINQWRSSVVDTFQRKSSRFDSKIRGAPNRYGCHAD